MSTSAYNDPPLQRPTVLETTTTTVGGGSHVHHRISWAAIFGGVILVVTVQLLLSLLGAGIGLGTVDVNAGTTPDAPNAANSQPPTIAPTTPSTRSPMNPSPCLLTILLAMNPAIRPRMSQPMMDMIGTLV